MSKSDTFENDLLKLIFNATAIANLADNAASGPLANLYVSLHTADPGEAGVQNTNEAAYTGYGRVAVARTSAGWTVSTSQVNPAANIDFGLCTAGTETETYFGIGVAASGATKLLYSGPISPTIGVSAGVTPRLNTSTIITED
jgi:hypothetical protein